LVNESIHIEDTPATTVVKTLARQAGLNIQFDQKILNREAGGSNGIPTLSFRWQNLTAAQALDAVLENVGWLMVSNPKSQVARIIPKVDAAPEPLFTQVIPLKYTSPTNLVTLLAGILSPRSKVLPDNRTSRVVVMATQAELDRITEYISMLDVPGHQILIEARFIETTASPTSAKGVDWSGTLANQNISFGNGLTSVNSVSSPGATTTATGTTPSGRAVSGATTTAQSVVTTATTTLTPTPPGTTTAPLPVGMSANTTGGFSPTTAFLNADGVSAVLSFLNTEADTESLATPRAVCLDGTLTELSVTRNIPVFEQTQGAQTGGGVVQPNTVKPNYNLKIPGYTKPINEVGIVLRVTPRVVGETNVMMELEPEISLQEVAPATTTLGGQLSTAPIFSRRKLNTVAMIPSGYTLVLGGLINDSANNTYTKVPFLGDIPVFGYAFRHDAKSVSKDNLLIFVTPTIVDTDVFQRTHSGQAFLKSKPLLKMNMEPDAINSGKPYDWTTPSK
jgi:type II secretory pathway component GspD/PulD (secretin)